MEINKLGTALIEFAKDFRLSNYAQWWLPIVLLLAVLLMSILLVRRISSWFPQTQEFQLRRMLLIAVSIVMTVTMAVFLYLWSHTSYYVHQTNQLIHWLSVLILVAVEVIFVAGFAFKYDRRQIKSLTHPAISKGENALFYKSSRQQFSKIKLWLLLPIASFLMLLFLLYRPNYMLGVLLDNSSSMSEHLENGKYALQATLRELNPNTTIIFSWFSEESPKTNMDQVLSEPSWQGLEGRHAFFDDQKQAVQYIERIPSYGGTPLYETLYGQLLYAQAQSGATEYKKKVLIIVTDGEDSYMTEPPQALKHLLCTNDDFDLFWDEVGIMNLGGSLTSPFMDKAANTCEYYIEQDATNISSYAAGIEAMTRGLKTSWYFPTWIALVYLAGLLICFFIPPKS